MHLIKVIADQQCKAVWQVCGPCSDTRLGLKITAHHHVVQVPPCQQRKATM